MDMNGNVPLGPAPMPENNEVKPTPDTLGARLSGSVPPTFPTPPTPPTFPTPPTPQTFPTSPTPPTPPSFSPPPPPPPMPTGGSGVVQAPPREEIDLRTMKSDAASLMSSGGTGVEPRTFNPSDFSKDVAFTPAVDAVAKAATPKRKTLFISIGIILVLGIAAAAVYFFVLPLFSNEPEVTVDETPIEEETPPITEEPAFVHQSFFASSVGESREAIMSTLTVVAVNAAFTTSDATEGTVEEVVFTANGEPVLTEDLMGIFMPGLDTTVFAEDFTAFVYHDENGDWPGYVFQLKPGSSAVTVGPQVSDEIEEGTNLNSFYPENPGAADSGGFKAGSVGSISTKYLSFAEAGASFNYGWSGDYLVLSTSFTGFRTAADLLGE